MLVDPDSYIELGQATLEPAISPEYEAELAAARAKSGVDEAIVTGEALIGGHRVALIACEFLFLQILTDVAARSASWPRSSGRRPSGFPSSPARPLAAPACRRARSPSSPW